MNIATKTLSVLGLATVLTLAMSLSTVAAPGKTKNAEVKIADDTAAAIPVITITAKRLSASEKAR